MPYLIKKISLDDAIKETARMEPIGIKEAAELNITEKERDYRARVRDYIISIHEYLKELKAIKEK